MNKTDDIPQDVWSVGTRMAGEYLSWLNAGNSTGSLSEHAVSAMADTISRAIMAEREACALVAEEDWDEVSGPHIADAIRNRGQS